MIPAFYVAHQTTDRTRLRLAGQPAQAPPPAQQREALERLAAALAEHLPDPDGLLHFDPRPATGSLVIVHPGLDGEALEQAFARLPSGPVAPPADPARPALAPLFDTLAQADLGLRAATAGGADLRTLLFLLLFGLAITQIVRGQFMAPAASLLWYALELVRYGEPPADNT